MTSPTPRDAIFAVLEDFKLDNMGDDDGQPYPLLDLMSNEAPATIETGREQMWRLADDILEALFPEGRGEQEPTLDEIATTPIGETIMALSTARLRIKALEGDLEDKRAALERITRLKNSVGLGPARAIAEAALLSSAQGETKPPCATCGGQGEVGGWSGGAASIDGGGGYETEPCPDCALSPRDQRQAVAFDWMGRAFGPQTIVQRAVRLGEETLEAQQVAGVPREMCHRQVDHVYDRPPGDLRQEIGGVGVTLLGLAAAAGISADEAEASELARVLAKPVEFFTARNAAKNAAGFDADAALVEGQTKANPARKSLSCTNPWCGGDRLCVNCEAPTTPTLGEG